MAALLKRSVFLRSTANSKHFYSNSASQAADVKVEYPAVRPRYPPGNWAGFDEPHIAWQWYDDQVAIDKLPTIQERLYQNIGSKNQLYYFDTKPFYSNPSLLDFYENCTKTELDSDLNIATASKIPEDRLKTILSDIEDTIAIESHAINRQPDHRMTESEVGVWRNKLLLNSIVTRLVVLLTQDQPQLVNSSLSRNAPVQTHWIYGGDGTPKAFTQVLPGTIRYGYKQNVALQLKSRLPLQTNKAVDTRKTVSNVTSDQLAEEKQEKITPNTDETLGLHNPHMRGLIKKCYSLPHSPGFRYGSVNDFVNLSVITPENSVRRPNSDDKDYKNYLASAGLLNTFCTSYAAAHYHGYDMHHDLVEPHTSQTIVTDGKQFIRVTHQLNTLCLFKKTVDNSRYNLYNCTGLFKLYESVNDSGKVVGFNEDAAKLIIDSLLAKLSATLAVNPYIENVSRTSDKADLLPYLPRYPRASDLPELLEGSTSIPTFSRYNNPNLPESDWDLPKESLLRRKKEREHEYYITKGPLFGSYDPPARGETNLDKHFEQKRKQEREERIKQRDRILEYQAKLEQKFSESV